MRTTELIYCLLAVIAAAALSVAASAGPKYDELAGADIPDIKSFDAEAMCNSQGFEATFVLGNVTDLDSQAVTGAPIRAECSHNGAVYALETETTGNGRFMVMFSRNRCDSGDNVTVTASKGSLKGTASGILSQYKGTSCMLANTDIMIKPERIPELGAAAFAVAAAGSIAGIALMKTR